MNSMRMFRSLFSVLIVASLLFGGVSVADISAADECRCFCTSTTGAVDTEKMLELNDCRSECEAGNGRIAAWACSANEYPSRSVNCFTSDQCAEHGGILDGQYQPIECPNGMHYCYADSANQEAVDLAVSIGGLTSTKDLGEYLSEGYKWLVGAMTTIAIVLLMVAGLRYAFGAVSANAVSAAKQRIVTLIVGLTLLLSTVLILATINPQLLRLSVPEFPMIKTISLVDNASCDELIALGYTIDYSGPEECGTTGIVEMDGDGNAVSDGTVCNFSKCSNSRALCVPGDEPTCMLCEELAADNPVLPPTPSLCSAFNALPDYETDYKERTASFTPTIGPNAGVKSTWTETVYDKYEACFFTRDPDAGGEVTGRGACARVVVPCTQISSCEEYDTGTYVFTPEGKVSLDSIDLGKNSGLDGTGSGVGKTLYDNLGEVTLGSFCGGGGNLGDICAWNRTEGDRACYINSYSVGAISDGAAAAALTFDYDCRTSVDTSSWFYTLFD